jgi:hypothetical protein
MRSAGRCGMDNLSFSTIFAPLPCKGCALWKGCLQRGQRNRTDDVGRAACNLLYRDGVENRLTVLRVRWWHHYKGPLVQTVGVALLLCGRKKGACSTVTFGGADTRCDTQVLMSQKLGRVVLLCHVHLFSLDVARCGYGYGDCIVEIV